MWIVDSGATKHMAHDKRIFLNYNPLPKSQLAYTLDGSTHEIQGIGDVTIVLSNGTKRIILEVHLIPNIKCNLFSAKQLAQASGEFSIKETNAVLYNSRHELIATTCLTNQDLYTLGHSYPIQPVDIQNSKQLALTTSTTNNLVSTWHNCLGHISLKRLQDLINNHMVKGINLKYIKGFPLCDSYILGKHHRTKFSKQAE
jgi:hypothetical protein